MQLKKLLVFYVVLSVIVFLAAGLWYPILSDASINMNAFIFNGLFAVILFWVTAVLTRHFTKRGVVNFEKDF